ncbi:tyrosine-type recombinase/integrase [Enterococcus xiangfangensis]|jgi:integrase|uniref:tyrosine-type recombinase/integrase n=1 Tax=Enterococcus xiangfangensis TaxID=1296537 RepID=UPI0010F6E30A|nr:tyrosine-type recombinase/integrase [Enterococcus xiangfangensis]MBM7710644.1 integrase [Enterococcus xiangfangensis]
MPKYEQYKDKNNKRKWMFSGYVATDPITGKKVVTKRKGFDTKKEAVATFDQLKARVLKGSKKRRSITFNELYNDWLEQHRKGVKPSTVATNRRFIENHVLPKFGKLKLDQITVSYCQKCVNEWHGKFRQYNYMRRAAAQVMSYGVSMELMDSNPMKKTILPRKKEDNKEPNFYNKEELKNFMDFVKTLDNYKYYAFFRLLAITGMRKSEALALYKSDLNIFNKTLTIGKTLAIDEFGTILLQEPKTKSSYRTISLDDETIRVLKHWFAIQKEDYLKLGYNTTKGKQLMFSNLSNDLFYPQVVNDWLDWIYDKAEKKGIELKRISPHGFRHTACSLMFESGATINEVQKRLGHKDVKTTMNIYSHVTPKQAENTSDKLAKYLAF